MNEAEIADGPWGATTHRLRSALPQYLLPLLAGRRAETAERRKLLDSAVSNQPYAGCVVDSYEHGMSYPVAGSRG